MRPLLLLPCLLLLALARATGAESAFRKIVLESLCDNPMELAPLPDGRVVFIERFGRVRVWRPDAQRSVLAGKLPVHGHVNAIIARQSDQGSWEAGLMGVAADPGFTTNQWLYLYWSPAGNVPENRVSRFTLRNDSLDLASEKVLLRVPIQREVCCHEAGSLAFDAQGHLFIATGDNTNPFESDGYNPVDARDGRHAFDAARSAGNANDLRGKILRVRPLPDGSCSIPEGNLFPPGTPNTRPEIFVMGCRNPFRISVDPASGILSWGEVGPDAREPRTGRGPAGFDEINRTRVAGNFGWPFFIADNKPYHAHDFATRASGDAWDPAHPVNPSPRNTGPRQLPAARPAWLFYPYAPSTRFPAVGSGGRTACAGPVYHFNPQLNSPAKLPAAFDGCLFIYDWERHWILAVHPSPDGQPGRMERFAPDIPLKRPVELELGPDGALYLIEFGSGWENNKDCQVARIEAVPRP